MKNLYRSLFGGVVVAVLLGAVTACVDTQQPRKDPVRLGARTFRVSCAGCHGVEADGLGPIASVLTVKVPDLRAIAARRKGQFPELEIFRIIDGQAEITSHGPRHMPIWGYEFFGEEADDEVAHKQATDKVDQLVAYLRSIQR